MTSRGYRLLALWAALTALACAPHLQQAGLKQTQPPRSPARAATPYSWPAFTEAPQFSEPAQDLRDLAKGCVRFERGLMLTAERIATAQLSAAGVPHGEAARGEARRAGAMGTDELKFALRAAGVPHTGQMSWLLTGTDLDRKDSAQRFEKWLRGLKPKGELRCGVAAVSDQRAREVIAVVVVDALGDLLALPTQARLGQWLTVDASFIVPVVAAKVVLMGPNGAPRPIPTSTVTGGHVHATASLDQPGQWLVQVLAELDTGPSSAFEAMVFVDTAPFASFTQSEARGESAGQSIADARSALVAMANSARELSRLPPLLDDPRLDQLANEQAQAMKDAHQLAHDLGFGGPEQRLTTFGLEPQETGEILAQASGALAAHRVIWASPAHRAALLEPRFTSLGVGVALDDDRSIWVCELFANFGAAGKILPSP